MFKVGDIVKFTNFEGGEVVGIVYENGNRTKGSFRVKAIGVKKYKGLEETDLAPATVEEFASYACKSQMLTPEQVIAEETAEAGGVLPEPITDNPDEGVDESGGEAVE
jgi:hypothetical protein